MSKGLMNSAGEPCTKCGRPVLRTYYRDAEILGQRKAIVLETCNCGQAVGA